MPKKTKLNLNDLTVSSFITKNQNNISGGISYGCAVGVGNADTVFDAVCHNSGRQACASEYETACQSGNVICTAVAVGVEANADAM